MRNFVAPLNSPSRGQEKGNPSRSNSRKCFLLTSLFLISSWNNKRIKTERVIYSSLSKNVMQSWNNFKILYF